MSSSHPHSFHRLESTNLGTAEELLLLLLEDASNELAGSLDGSSLQFAQLGVLGSLTLGEVFLVRLGVVLLLLGLLLSLGLGGRGGLLKGQGWTAESQRSVRNLFSYQFHDSRQWESGARQSP
jgi:hypothetical protein